MTTQQKTGAEVRSEWAALKIEQPSLRARDAASQLGVSEAALVASRIPETATVLAGDFGELLKRLPSVGRVMVLTRNEHVVHEKKGQFDKVSVGDGFGLVLNHDIDLRLFMSHWRHGFALTDDLGEGKVRHSLQFFDAEGVAIHKIYAQPDSDLSAWDEIIEAFRAPDQSADFSPLTLASKPPDRPDSEIDIDGLRAHWANLQDTHEFFGMLNDFKVGRHQAMRLAGSDFVRPVSLQAPRQMLEAAAENGVPIMCFVGNRGCIQIHTGPVKTIKVMGPWLNVLDPDFNLHLREDAIAHAYVVRKPTRDGDVTSLELFDAEGKNFVMFFGERKPGQVEREDWRSTVRALEPGSRQAA